MQICDRKLGDYFRIHKLLLRICGISLQTRDSRIYRAYSTVILCLFLSIMMEEVYTVTRYTNDLNKVMSVLSVLLSHIVGVFKIYVLVKHRSLICEILESFHEGMFAPNRKRGGVKEEILIKRCIADTHKQIIVYCFPFSISFLNASIIALMIKFMEEDCELWELPWKAFGLFNICSSLRYYMVYLYQNGTLLVVSYIIIGTDLMIIAVFTHVTTQFAILANFISITVRGHGKNLTTYADFEEKPKRYYRTRVKEIVVYHHALIHLADRFEDLFTFVILAVFLGNILVLCSTMYLTTLNSLGNPKSLLGLTYGITVAVQVFLYCYYGNELALTSESISLSCYDGGIIGTDVSFQKDLILIMQRSQRPVVLTAGKFAKLLLPAFVSILRASYSYFMVIRRSE